MSKQMRISRTIATQHSANEAANSVLMRAGLFKFTRTVITQPVQRVMDKYLRDEENYKKRQDIKRERRLRDEDQRKRAQRLRLF